MTDFLDDKRREITARLNELGPLVDEYNRLTAAASALEGIGGASVAAAAAAPSRRGPGRPPGSSSKTATIATAAPAKKRGRPPGRPKKVGRPKTKKVGRPPGRPKAPAATAAPAASAAAATTTTHRTPARRTAQRQRHACRAGAEARAGTARHHDPRARGEDGHQAELPLPRAARARAGKQDQQAGSRLAPQILGSSPLAVSSIPRVPIGDQRDLRSASTPRSLRPGQKRRSVGLTG